MDRAHWRSPAFRGRSPHPHRHSNPRFRGDGGSFGSPRHYSPQWQQRSPSPYHYQNQQGHGSSFSPRFQHHGHHPYATSTPVHGFGGSRRPYFRGGGRFNKRQSFGSPSLDKNTSGDDIENWVSPEMWADPWRHLTTSEFSSTQFSNITLDQSGQEETKFAESDFDVTPSQNTTTDENDTLSGVSHTKFAESDFNVTEVSGLLKNDCSTSSTSKALSSNMKLDQNEISLELEDEDELEKYATDRVVLDSIEQVPS